MTKRIMLMGIALVLALGCGSAGMGHSPVPADAPSPFPGHVDGVTVLAAAVGVGQQVQMTAAVAAVGTIDRSVTWSLAAGALGGVDAVSGVYSAPSTAGTFAVVATSVADATQKGSATVAVSAAPPPAGRVLAFPGCEGAGCNSAGGRGGAVYKVTNLADSGTGSLRACVQASGPRTCVFTVGGRIDTTSEMRVTNPYLTIAGQTAPGGGIAVVGRHQGGYVFSVRTHDVTVRYVRFFNDANPPCNASSQGCGVASIVSPSRDVTLDHVTAAYTQDENLSVWSSTTPATSNITVSWMLNAYPLADHPTGTVIGGSTSAVSESMTDIDFHHNYYANVGHRSFMGGAKRVRWAYNIVFNYQWYASRTGSGVIDDFVGNLYRCGNQSTCTRFPLTLGSESAWPTGTPSIYFSNNVWKDAAGRVKVAANLADADQWAAMVYSVTNSSVSADSSTPAPLAYRRTGPNAAPVAGTPIAADAAGPYRGFTVVADGSNLETLLLDTTATGDAARGTAYGPVGASRSIDCNGNLRNNVDGLLQRAIAEYLGGGSAAYAPAGGSALPATQNSLCWSSGQCGVPVLAPGVACADSDGDGMPDAWEAHWGLDPADAGGENGPSGHGISADYTNLEMYLNGGKGF